MFLSDGKCLARSQKRTGPVNSHIEHIADGFAFVTHLQRFAVVTFAVAGIAIHIHIGQKFISMVLTPAPPQGFAASALYIKRKAAGFIPRILASGISENKLRISVNTLV